MGSRKCSTPFFAIIFLSALWLHSVCEALELVEIFSDKFDSPGRAVDPAKWSVLTGDGKINANEVSRYSAEDVWQENDHLLVRANVVKSDSAPDEYYSGAIYSKVPFQFGEVEWRVKLPTARGFFAGLSLVPEGCPPTGPCADGSFNRIDVLQYRGDIPNRVSSMLVYGNVNTGVRHDGSETYKADGTFTDGGTYHLFKVVWDDVKVVFLVDGVEKDKIVTPEAIPHRKMYLVIHTSLGGWYPGPPDGTTPFPVHFVVDEVSVKRWQ
ncbi:hypothetical protein BV898_09045, partial [Hypsibius exemplaris]